MTSYKIDELAHKAQVSPRTIRYYVQRGLLPAPEFRGKDTTYDKGHLLRLRVIKKLQEEHLPLEEIQARIEGASHEELERLIRSGRRDLGTPAPSQAQQGGPYRFPAYQEPLPPAVPSAFPERWDRVHLAPGLELHVRGDAGRETRRIAREIAAQFGQRSFTE